MRYLKGPDFPTGGLVVNKDDLLKIYETGTGKLRVRGKVETVKLKGGRQQLVITEIPYTMIGAKMCIRDRFLSVPIRLLCLQKLLACLLWKER